MTSKAITQKKFYLGHVDLDEVDCIEEDHKVIMQQEAKNSFISSTNV